MDVRRDWEELAIGPEMTRHIIKKSRPLLTQKLIKV
jgi:hypothetical protein